MCRTLGIDGSSEFYLLGIALHALESPQEWTRVSDESDTFEQSHTDIEWFRELVRNERARFQRTPTDNSPWVKIKDTIQTTTNQTNTKQTSTTSNITAASAAPHSVTAAAASSSSSAPSSTRSYYYNFKTFRSSNTLPPARRDVLSPTGTSMRVGSLAVGGGGVDPPVELDVMRFTSYWFEGATKRHIKILYYLAAEEFEVILIHHDPTAPIAAQKADEETQTYRVKTLKTKHGPATCWDLHLKATLDIFGRPTTLMQCESEKRGDTNEKSMSCLVIRFCF